MNLEGDDRLSSLPEDLIYKILSYNGIKRAIKLSTLASKWRYMWTSMPFLDFSSEDFSTLTKFSAFVANVLSRRNNQAQVYSIKLRFVGDVSHDFVKQIMDYAFSHNIQRLDVTCLLEDHSVEFPLSLFSSQSLKHLSLKRDFIVRWGESENFPFSYDLTTTSTWELPALTSLYLGDLTLCDDSTDKHSGLFSKCLNLKNLTLTGCKFIGSNGLCIWHPLLTDLTIYSVHGNKNFFIVVAPQLKNLNISGYWTLQYLVSAPSLTSLLYSGIDILRLSTDGFHSLEKADLCVSGAHKSDVHLIINLFQQLQSVKFLKLNLEVAERLSEYVELISNQTSPFGNLKSLKIYPYEELSEVQEQKIVGMSAVVKSYLLDSSSGATFTMVTRKEIRAMNNTRLVQKLMTSLWRLLKREKVRTDTNGTHLERWKRQWGRLMENCHEEDRAELENEMQMTCINSCWEDISVQIEKGKEVTCDIVSSLQEIKDVMIKLPTSKRAEMQACFSSLCAEADTVVNNMIHRVTLKGSHFVHFFCTPFSDCYDQTNLWCHLCVFIYFRFLCSPNAIVYNSFRN